MAAGRRPSRITWAKRNSSPTGRLSLLHLELLVRPDGRTISLIVGVEIIRSCSLLTSACHFRPDKAHERPSPSRSKKDDVVFLRCSALHPRRSRGHAWNRQANGAGPLLQQLPQSWRGHVPLDDVPSKLGRMTGGKVRRYTKPFPYDFQVSDLLDRDGEAGGLKMLHPACAASAIRILVNENAWSLAESGGRRHDQCRRRQSKYASSRQSARMTCRWTIHGLGSPILVAKL